MNDTLMPEVIDFLSIPASYPHEVSSIIACETHISYVFLTGEYAYKLKKPVKFEFLDFTSIEKREHFCREEVRLNARFAPELYLEVIPISRSREGLSFGAGGEIVDHVIKMRQFEKDSLFDELAVRGELRESYLIEITDAVSRFHRTAELQPDYWAPDYVAETLQRNIDVCAQFCPDVLDPSLLKRLEISTRREFDCLKELIRVRQLTHVRALHGDLHLRNMCIFRGQALLFDGIEFNPQLSNCDTWADFAFFVMDLLFRERNADAALVWNYYLQETDDFAGFQLLNLYTSYRAAVRAMVTCLALRSAHTPDSSRSLALQAAQYLQLAVRVLESRRSGIVAVGGLAGSGKSTLSSKIARHFQAVHIRSDAVRKHLNKIPLTERAPQGAYSDEMNQATYLGLIERARNVLAAGYPVVIDAVFHSPERRRELEELAESLGVPFTGIWCKVSQKIAKERVRMRVGDISDADEAVVALQEAYAVGQIAWHQLDTSQHQTETLRYALDLIPAPIADALSLPEGRLPERCAPISPRQA